jgi:hypothetical protein
MIILESMSMRRCGQLWLALGVFALSAAGCGDAPVSSTDLGDNLAAPRPPAVTPPATPTPTTPTTPSTPTPPPSLAPGQSYWDFNVSPPAPIAFDEPGWDVQMYSRDVQTWLTPEPMDAHHGMDCAGYPGQHRVTSYEQLVYRCRNHIMTAIQAEGYGAIALTPDRLLDWSATAGVVRFDMSTFKSSNRDWIHVWISPYDRHLVLPAVDWAAGLNGPPRDGVYVEQTMNGNLCPWFVRNFVVTALACDDSRPLSDRIVLSATRRNTVEIRLTNDRIRVSLPGDSIVFADVSLPAPLTFAQGIVQFGHYSYNPTKCAPCSGPQVANTWHWDEIFLAPSIPFTIIRGDRRYVDGPSGTVTFRTPAPSGARLRFSVFGMEPDISFDDGRTWQVPVSQEFARVSQPERQYWTPIPAGTTRVMLRPARAISWWGQPTTWIARDFAVWAR